MKREKSLLVVSDDNLITRIIRSLKSFLKIKQCKVEEVSNRTAEVITSEKIQLKLKKDIGIEELQRIEENILNDISYINVLNEEELNLLDGYYDTRINELENLLNEKKSKYYKLISAKRI